MKIKATMRLLPIVLVSAIMAVSCTGVQDVANTTTPNPTVESLNGKYTYSEVMDSVQIQVSTPTPQYIYMSRDYFLELSDNNQASLFVSEWASADRVIVTQFKGTYSVANNLVQLELKNMTMCDGVEIFVTGQIQGSTGNIQLAMQHCPPVSNNIVFKSDASVSAFNVYTINSTTHN